MDHNHPKDGNDGNTRKTSRKFHDLLKSKNPIVSEIKDPSKVNSMFRKYPLYPYAGTNEKSSDTMQDFFYNVNSLSTTDQACISRLTEFILGDGLNVRIIDDEFVDDNPVQTDPAVRSRFKDVIKKGVVNEGNLLLFITEYFKHYKITGDAFIRLTLVETLGERTFKIEVVPNRTIRKLMKDKKPTDFWVLSPIFSEEYFRIEEPTIISEYPMYSEINGTKQTIFHYKNGGYIYGRPDTVQATMHKYSEFQNIEHRIKMTDNKFSGDIIIEASKKNPNGPLELNAQDYENNFTNKSDDPLSLMYSERDFDASPLFVYQLKPNTNEKYYDVIDSIDARKIITSHGLTEKLVGINKTTGIAGSDFMTELKTRLPLIRNHQNTILFTINKMITEIMIWIDESLVGNGIDFVSKLLDEAEIYNGEVKKTDQGNPEVSKEEEND